ERAINAAHHCQVELLGVSSIAGLENSLLIPSEVYNAGEPRPKPIAHLVVVGFDVAPVDVDCALVIVRYPKGKPSSVDVTAQSGYESEASERVEPILDVQPHKVASSGGGEVVNVL